jgi:hypothetical protein
VKGPKRMLEILNYACHLNCWGRIEEITSKKNLKGLIVGDKAIYTAKEADIYEQ